MDLSYSPEELAFQREVRAWLKKNVPKPDTRDANPVEGAPDKNGSSAPRRGSARCTTPATSRWAGRNGVRRPRRRRHAADHRQRGDGAGARAGLIGMMGIQMVGPTLIAHGTEEQRRHYLPQYSRPPRRSGVRDTRSRAPGPISRRCRPAPSSSATSSSSTARRSGPRARSTPTGCSASCAPIPRRRSTAASPTS